MTPDDMLAAVEHPSDIHERSAPRFGVVGETPGASIAEAVEVVTRIGSGATVHDEREVHVTGRPGRPLLVFDGDCRFCRQWVGRWRGITGERVEYRPWQEVAGQFPEIGEERFRARAWLIEPDGQATGGARAVFRLYAMVEEKHWLSWSYENSPAFAGAAEGAYDLVARYHKGAAIATRWHWGTTVERPRYRRMRAIFLRGLGAVYLAAFWSMAVQVDGLIGSRGILPAGELLGELGPILGRSRYWQLPTLLWLDSSDRALHLLSWGGAVLSGLLVAGVLPRACLVPLWLSYLSIVGVGQPFFGYQWDALLLEAGLLAVLFAPRGLRLGQAGPEPPRGVIWLLRWLVFLMFLSGVVKLTSGDPACWAWEAMKYHYETQPLPTWTSWLMHHLPSLVPRGVGRLRILGRVDRPAPRLRTATDTDAGFLEPRPPASPDRGDGQLRVLQCALDRTLPVPDRGQGLEMGPVPGLGPTRGR